MDYQRKKIGLSTWFSSRMSINRCENAVISWTYKDNWTPWIILQIIFLSYKLKRIKNKIKFSLSSKTLWIIRLIFQYFMNIKRDIWSFTHDYLIFKHEKGTSKSRSTSPFPLYLSRSREASAFKPSTLNNMQCCIKYNILSVWWGNLK